MRPWRIVAASCLTLVSSSWIAPAWADDPPTELAATASPEADARPPMRIGYGALPGGLHVAAAEGMPQGTVELGLISGFGYRKGLIAADHAIAETADQIGG